jgi:hypothetical protein
MGAYFGEDNDLQIMKYLTCVIVNDVTSYTYDRQSNKVTFRIISLMHCFSFFCKRFKNPPQISHPSSIFQAHSMFLLSPSVV